MEEFAKKEDWENYKKTLIAHLKNVEIDYSNFQNLLTIVTAKLETFKDESEKIVDEVINGTASADN